MQVLLLWKCATLRPSNLSLYQKKKKYISASGTLEVTSVSTQETSLGWNSQEAPLWGRQGECLGRLSNSASLSVIIESWYRKSMLQCLDCMPCLLVESFQLWINLFFIFHERTRNASFYPHCFLYFQWTPFFPNTHRSEYLSISPLNIILVILFII